MRYLNLIWPLILWSCSEKADLKLSYSDTDHCQEVNFEHARLSKFLKPFDSLMEEKTGVFVLEHGDISMTSRAWIAQSAEKSIDIQYFIFSPDKVGLIAIDYLLRAADRGVKVRMIVDDFMVEADAEELLAYNAHPNFEIKIYNPTANIGKNIPEKLLSAGKDFKGFNQRMHNKTFIVDGKVVITGGRNIADEYFDYNRTYNFRDRDVLLVGGKVKMVQGYFNLFWNSDLSVSIHDIADFEKFDIDTAEQYHYLHQFACDPENFWPEIREKIRLMPLEFKRIYDEGKFIWVDEVDFISDVPGKNEEKNLGGSGITTESLIKLIRTAQNSITIQTPYLITTELGLGLFKETTDRGVTVKILTNSLSSTDNLEAFSGYRRVRKNLLDMGVKIYEFKPDAKIRFDIMTSALQREINYQPLFGLHAKSMAIDDKISVIGTFNLDPRSANLNTECVTVVYDSAITTKMRAAMDVDMLPENAWRTTMEFNPDGEAGWYRNLKVWLRGFVPKSIL